MNVLTKLIQNTRYAKKK